MIKLRGKKALDAKEETNGNVKGNVSLQSCYTLGTQGSAMGEAAGGGGVSVWYRVCMFQMHKVCWQSLTMVDTRVSPGPCLLHSLHLSCNAAVCGTDVIIQMWNPGNPCPPRLLHSITCCTDIIGTSSNFTRFRLGTTPSLPTYNLHLHLHLSLRLILIPLENNLIASRIRKWNSKNYSYTCKAAT